MMKDRRRVMASITEQVSVSIDADRAWRALRDVGRAHELFAPVLVKGSIDGGVRTVTFANGMVLDERILDVDDERRRVAYAVLNGPGMEFHHASMQILDAGPGRCQFVWITDVHPAAVVASITPLITQGTQALKKNLEIIAAEPTVS
jgi:hypothetical protein